MGIRSVPSFSGCPQSKLVSLTVGDLVHVLVTPVAFHQLKGSSFLSRELSHDSLLPSLGSLQLSRNRSKRNQIQPDTCRYKLSLRPYKTLLLLNLATYLGTLISSSKTVLWARQNLQFRLINVFQHFRTS